MNILLDIRHPLLTSLVGLSVGSAVAGILHPGIPLWAPVAAVGVLIAVMLARLKLTYYVILFLVWSLWGAAAVDLKLDQAMGADLISFCGREPVAIEGVVAGRPDMLPDGERFRLKVEAVIAGRVRTTTDGSLLVTVSSGRTGVQRGDRIRFSASLRVPRQLGLPGEFNYSRHLALKGISATAWVKDAGQVVVMRHAAISSLRRWIDGQSQRCREAIRSALPAPDIGAVMTALVTGGQQEIPPPLVAAYARAGVSHILSISGFHLGIISFVLVQFIAWLLLRSERLSLLLVPRRAALFLSFPVVIYYLFFTGAAPATVRAAVMLGAVALAFWAEREEEILNALLTAAFLILLLDPAVLFDVSFQFSFLALWGIIVLTPVLLSPFEPCLSGWRRSVAQLLAASTAASLATAVPALMVFHQTSFTGILANLVIVPLLGYGATIIGAVAIPLLLLLPAFAGPLLWIGGLLVQASNVIVLYLAGLPVIRSFSFGAPELVVIIMLLALFSLTTLRSLRITGGLVAAFVVLAPHFWPVSVPDGQLRLIFLSVGQAESTLLKLPDGRTMLIDGGGYLHDRGRDFGERYLVPALHAMKVRRIDYLVLTHPHPDHMGGLPAVAEQFPVGEFWQGPWDGTGPEYVRLRSALARSNVPVKTVRSGDHPLTMENLAITVLAPSAAVAVSGEGGGNEDSVVLRIRHRNFSALLTGDAGLPVEDLLLKNGLEKTTLLKVGHHGSRTASGQRFLEQLRPEIGLISVGADNRFGLPAPEVVQRLRRHGVRIYRTDLDGTVQVESDGAGYRVRTAVTGG